MAGVSCEDYRSQDIDIWPLLCGFDARFLLGSDEDAAIIRFLLACLPTSPPRLIVL
jgi:hypothetical protein